MSTQGTAAQAAPKSAVSPIKQYFLDFRVLVDNQKEFWLVQTVNLLDLTAYFSMIATITLFLTGNIGMTEVHSGYTVTAFTTLLTLVLPIAGAVTDSLGIKRSLIVAMLIQTVSRLGIVYCGFTVDVPGRAWLVVALLVLGAPGMGMTQTIYQAANRRFSSGRSRSASFNVWYLVMNMGGVAGGLMVDLIRKTLDIDITWIFIFGAVAAVLSIGVAFFITREEQVVGEGDAPEEQGEVEKKKPWQILKSVISETAFWRFLVLMFSLLGVRSVFAYMYLIMPLYWVRVIEEVSGEKTDQGFLQALNPILIVAGLILFIPLANKFNVFKMLVFGAIISALSLLCLVLPWDLYANEMAVGYFRMSVAMLVVLSIGEVFWSPKLTEYTAAIAPKGQEGTYLGMSMMPWFLAKLAVSAMSGHMLARWVPVGIGKRLLAGEVEFWDRPEAMWLILFFWAISGPIFAWIFRGWLTKGANMDPGGDKAAAEEAAADAF